MNTIILIYLVLFVAPISNLVHEIGHVIGAMLAKADKITLFIGRGKQIIRFVYQTIEVKVGFLFFTTGLTESIRNVNYKPLEIVFITFFGPLLNAVAVLIFYLLYEKFPSDYILVFMLYNGWLFIVNCIPFKIKGQESDGYIILKEMLRK